MPGGRSVASMCSNAPDVGGSMSERQAPGDREAEPWWSTIVPPDPRSVGEEPDYRFTLANERTFLAWIRTALALAAGGLGAIALLEDLAGSEVLGVGLLALSFVTSATAYRRWARNEAAMRLGEPLRPSRLPVVMTVGAALFALVGATLIVIEGV